MPETITMKKKVTIRIIILAFAVSGLLVVLGFSSSRKAEATQECLDGCTMSPETGEKTTFDNLSHQFFSSI